MGALSKLIFGGDKVNAWDSGGKPAEMKHAVTMTTAMTEANFSGKLYGHEAQMVAAFLPKCT
jgi:hypothetical protein